MFRFFVNQRENDTFILSPATLKHMQVARIGNKAFICVYQAQFYQCVLENNVARIEKELPQNHEWAAPVVLALSLIEETPWEWALQKATELGVTVIVPIISAYTNKHLARHFQARRGRYETILQSAAAQSFRNIIPTLQEPIAFTEALSLPYRNLVLAHEKAAVLPVTSFEPDTLFFVGPEGGFSDQEVALAKQAKAQIVSLGSRILRAETAALVLLAKISAV